MYVLLKLMTINLPYTVTENEIYILKVIKGYLSSLSVKPLTRM
jgi:hypothetical protein